MWWNYKIKHYNNGYSQNFFQNTVYRNLKNVKDSDGSLKIKQLLKRSF